MRLEDKQTWKIKTEVNPFMPRNVSISRHVVKEWQNDLDYVANISSIIDMRLKIWRHSPIEDRHTSAAILHIDITI